MPEKGSIIVQAFTARRAIPVENATVIITTDNDIEPKIIAYRVTDVDGRTTPVELETPDISNSQTPSEAKAFATCNIQLDHPMYYSVLVEHVQVFPETESIQQVEMIPLMEFANEDEKSNVVIITPQDL
ncbi:MAG: hypothetical protein ACK5MV_02560 [Aminipila sp.]